ncbi:unnamed protein product, partial [Onchocerca flexuosa]|uniref:DUF4378 domain-containing protein n=1 Tax=Onchocerca flexuosa TaxID=387005 RepID=A0A183HWU6_9BILA
MKFFVFPKIILFYFAETSEIHKHEVAPISSGTKICPTSCGSGLADKKLPQNEPLHKASILPDESINTESVTFDVVMRILNRDWDPHFANRNTREFHQLAAEVINEVNAMVKTEFPEMR